MKTSLANWTAMRLALSESVTATKASAYSIPASLQDPNVVGQPEMHGPVEGRAQLFEGGFGVIYDRDVMAVVGEFMG